MNLRTAAAKVINQVSEGISLSQALPSVLKQLPEHRDQAFVQALCFGVCRRYFYLQTIANLLLEKPLKEKDQDIYHLLLIGLYQLIDMRVPAHAAVAETVAAAKDFKKIWAKGLINAVLRNFQRREAEIQKKIQQENVAIYSHPKWMIEKLQQDWPQQWQEILAANDQHPPMALRVNQQKMSRQEYLTAQMPHAQPIPETQSGIVLDQPVDVLAIPGFLKGEVSVQDGAAQLAAELLHAEPGQRVLDACAAPGGKTTHILECQPRIEKLIAIDDDENRLVGVRENLQRLQLQADCICADAGEVEQWWDGKLFDRILLDAPCSASGVIRRHPDIKLLRRETDIVALAKEQLRLLTMLWSLVKPQGLLVYVTCSVFSEENVQVLSKFLANHDNVREEKIKASWGKECSIGRQILPGMHGMDGFYFAVLKKL